MRKVDIKLVLVGKQGAGKSALATRLKDNTYSTSGETTIGAAFLTHKQLSKDETTTIKANIWDTAGMERFRSLIPMYLRETSMILFCFDYPSIENIRDEINSIKHTIDISAGERQIVLVQTKIDTAPTFNPDFNKELDEELKQFAAKENYKLYRTSAKLGTGIKELFAETIEESYMMKRDSLPIVILERSDFRDDLRSQYGERKVSQLNVIEARAAAGGIPSSVSSLEAASNIGNSCCTMM